MPWLHGENQAHRWQDPLSPNKVCALSPIRRRGVAVSTKRRSLFAIVDEQLGLRACHRS